MKITITNFLNKKRLLFAFVLACGFSLNATNDFNFFSSESTDSNKSEEYSSGNSETIMSDDELNFWGEQPELKAPPGGGAPIGGVPVEDGYLVLSAIGLSYLVFKNRKKIFS